MITAIMQPYFFPYLGYFQLIAQCDTFVFYDDAQYITRGWISRNRVLQNGESSWLTLPLRNGSSRAAINERYYDLESAAMRRMLRRLRGAYRQAPQFAEIFPLIEELLNFHDANVAAFNVNLLREIAAHIGLQPQFVLSSAIEKDPALRGQDRVIDICRRLGATHYVTPIGGAGLYDADRFAAADVRLSFLQSASSHYPQFGQATVPNLSIIDVLMFNDKSAVAGLLREFHLVDPNR